MIDNSMLNFVASRKARTELKVPVRGFEELSA